MQIEKDGIVYEVVKVVEDKMSDEEKTVIIAANEKRLSELWDIYIDDSWSPAMQEILQKTQNEIEEEREFLEGEIAMLKQEDDS